MQRILCQLLMISLFVPIHVHAQTTGTTTTTSSLISKDPTAISIIQNSLISMNPGQASLSYADSVATGTLTSFGTGKPVDMAVTMKSKGLLESRIETQTAKGTNVGIFNGGQGASLRPDGSVRRVRSINVLVERVDYIPLFSFLAEWQSPNVMLQNVGTSIVNGRPVNVISMSLAFGGNANEQQRALAKTRILFSIDQPTGMVSKIEYQLWPENGSTADKLEVFLSDYRSVSGIYVPFQQADYQNGQLESQLTLNSVGFNVGLSDQEFALPQ
jgi:hypothetical protein